MLSKIIHAAGAMTFGYALYYQLFRIQVPPHLRDNAMLMAIFKPPGNWKYLTVWDLVLQLAYHTYSLVNDFKGSSELEPKKQTTMQKIRDTMFASVVFPIGMFVSMTFWGLYAIDRELVCPKIQDEFSPSWHNHAVHTAPFFLLFVEFYCIPKVFPKRSSAVLGNISSSGIYLGWVMWVASSTGVWAYPVLEVLDNVSRAAFMGGCAGAMLGLYFIGEKFQKWRWGAALAASEDKAGHGKKKVQ